MGCSCKKRLSVIRSGLSLIEVGYLILLIAEFVKLTLSNQRLLFFACCRVARCGGCCSHDLLECQPNETETRSMFVFHWTISEQGQIQYQGKKPVELEVHKSCRCGCKIKPEVNLLQRQISYLQEKYVTKYFSCR